MCLLILALLPTVTHCLVVALSVRCSGREDVSDESIQVRFRHVTEEEGGGELWVGSHPA